ncbi:hypothetical protein LRH25_22435 [Ideonella azotifigens]|nr:hypothetical protein [Ideonella azotifigens]
MGYGSGEIRPKAAAAVELVYDASRSDYDAYLCGKGLADADTCANAGSVSSQNLNLPSLTAVVPGQTKIERRLTNVSEHAVTYSAKAQLVGFDVKVKPAQLTLAPGESAPFTVVLSRTDAPEASWQFGSLTWKSSQGGQPITSPLSALQQSFKIATNLSSQSASFKTALPFTAGYSGALDTHSTGLIAGQALAGTVTAQDFSSCVNIPVAAGSMALHLQMFDSDTSHPGQDNLALSVTGPDGNGYWSGQPGANQAIDVAQPAQGTYQACVLALSLVGDASSYTVWSWDLPGSGSAGLPLSTTAPTQVKAGQNGKIKLAWSVPDAQRYMGAVQFRDGKGNTLATTSISVDPQSVGTVNTVRGNARHQDPGLQTR